MKLENEMLVKFKNDIEPDKNEFNKRYEDEYFKMLDRIQGKIVTVKSTDVRYGTGETTFEVWEDGFIGKRFPITYLECVIPTIPINNPKLKLKDECVVILKNEKILMYNNGKFYKEYNPIICLNQYNEDLEFGYRENRNQEYDIIQIYSDWTTFELIWER